MVALLFRSSQEPFRSSQELFRSSQEPFRSSPQEPFRSSQDPRRVMVSAAAHLVETRGASAAVLLRTRAHVPSAVAAVAIERGSLRSCDRVR